MSIMSIENDASSISIPVLLLEQDGEHTSFLHLGEKFRTRNNAILDIEACEVAIPMDGRGGIPSQLRLSRDAILTVGDVIVASELMNDTPFPMTTPSATSTFRKAYSVSAKAEEESWLAEQGVKVSGASTGTTYTRTDSAQSTESRSNGVIDDQSSDNMPNDDATPSD